MPLQAAPFRSFRRWATRPTPRSAISPPTGGRRRRPPLPRWPSRCAPNCSVRSTAWAGGWRPARAVTGNVRRSASPPPRGVCRRPTRCSAPSARSSTISASACRVRSRAGWRWRVASLRRLRGALRPPLLAGRIDRDRALLARVGLRPSLITMRVADGNARLEALWRVARSLNPDLVLQRGYARVEADGHVVAGVARARQVGAMTLVFADGRVDVATTDAPPPPPRAKPKASPASSLQPRLL